MRFKEHQINQINEEKEIENICDAILGEKLGEEYSHF